MSAVAARRRAAPGDWRALFGRALDNLTQLVILSTGAVFWPRSNPSATPLPLAAADGAAGALLLPLAGGALGQGKRLTPARTRW